MKAIVMETFGGPEVLRLAEAANPVPADDEVLVEVRFAGVNFMDVGTRTDRGGNGTLPCVPGVEGMGVVRRLEADVTGLEAGRRVAWYLNYGSYAELIALPASALIPVPEEIEDEVAAALPMQGLTAHHLATASYPVEPGDVCVVHAAAGGVGLLLTQIAKLRGGRVIGVVSTEAKAQLARRAGADDVIVGSARPLSGRVRELTNGRGADVVFDGVGAATFQESLASLRPHGTLVSFGQAGGSVPPISLESLPDSVLVTYSMVMHHVPDRAALLAHTGELFDWVASGKLKVSIGEIHPLAAAEAAHRAIEGRGTTGKVLLRVRQA
ncbi:quinone oxidoreductase family protein [Actinacidiphila guanduensis]|uniref:NADPH:quinone reductase n=1 Tax=Actinacidiphila guanduensis TaxID=310781 RepID=A0A1H0PXL7_9ACTN|nr:quinone oxidoreductase [Actinacidiphila guanduensis]SDP09823.1 NADPH:quinone reductase [Actinacidiphila guanduensis]